MELVNGVVASSIFFDTATSHTLISSNSLDYRGKSICLTSK